MGAAQPIPKYSLTEYLEFEECSDAKHEYLAGQIYLMAGASPSHNQICFNLAGVFANRLESGKCRGYSSDQKIWIEAVELSTYADITIVCGEPQFQQEHRTLLLNPRVIVEVLSPGTEAYDRGEKWSYYQHIPSLTDYVLVAQQRAQIELFSLEQDGSWRYARETNLLSEVMIASIDCRLPLAEVYRDVEFPPIQTRPPIQIVIDL